MAGGNAVVPVGDTTSARALSPVVAGQPPPHEPVYTSLYIIQPIHQLPEIDLTHTVAGVLVGRRHARAVNAWVIQTATQYTPLWYLLTIPFFTSSALLFLVKDVSLRYLLTAIIFTSTTPVFLIHTAALCWDLLLLLLQTFEFCFLFAVNAVDNIIWDLLCHDVRALAMVSIAATCSTIFFLDANLHMRVFVMRGFLLGSSGLLFAIVMVAFRLTPDLVYTTIHIWGRQLETLDVNVAGTTTVIFFMAVRSFKYRRLIFSLRLAAVQPASAMQCCEMYFPICRLVKYDDWLLQRRRLIDIKKRGAADKHHAMTAKTQLEFVESEERRLVNARDTLLHKAITNIRSPSDPQPSRLFVWMPNASGLVGWGLMVISCVVQLIHSKPLDTGLSVAMLVTTIGFVVVHASHFQRMLAHCICLEIDAWFVSFQATVVTIGACDAFHWDGRAVVLVTAWIWCHWLLFLDALLPCARRQLSLTRGFILAINTTLLLYPLCLSYVLYYSHREVVFRNRIIFHVKVAHVEVVVEMLSFLPSHIFTLWLWMGRFLWREALRPIGSFKLIKFRVQFSVNQPVP